MATTLNEYNGYTNYGTWAVNLWIDEENVTREEAHAVVLDAFCAELRAWEGLTHSGGTPYTREENEHGARSLAADALKEWVDAWAVDTERDPDVTSDLLSWALGLVDYHDLVRTWLMDDYTPGMENDDDDDDESEND